MPALVWFGTVIVGGAVGFLAGLFGKGGSAIATPMLHALGVPAIVAVAAPLPATIPSTLAATVAYWREDLLDRQVLGWSVAFGIPATVVGAYATRWIGGDVLVRLTDLVLVGLGVRFLLKPGPPSDRRPLLRLYRLRLALVATAVGVSAGLLANSGGFLLAPLYIAVLRLPVKTSFACSLAVAAALAVPGTIVHWALGHIDWPLVAVFGAASVPLSNLGAHMALKTRSDRLERGYGVLLAILGITFLMMKS